ncbi:MAG TPA: tetratricopeptide repeat protein [Terriglobales bacterium]|nr:tetratricopeptide repeat protein [Terriglobales bacterium]
MGDLTDFARRVMDQMLEADTERHIAEQKAALSKDPNWAEGHYHLGQLYRVQSKREEARLELLRALQLKPSLADAHVALGEMYAADGEMEKAREHAEYAARFGNRRLKEQLERYSR